jgi:hypothetical protein
VEDKQLLVDNYGKHLANTNRSTPLSESKARNLSSPVFVVWQQYSDLLPGLVSSPSYELLPMAQLLGVYVLIASGVSTRAVHDDSDVPRRSIHRCEVDLVDLS